MKLRDKSWPLRLILQVDFPTAEKKPGAPKSYTLKLKNIAKWNFVSYTFFKFIDFVVSFMNLHFFKVLMQSVL